MCHSQTQDADLPGWTHKDRFQAQSKAHGQTQTQKKLVLEGDGGARYFGVIQVIDFCNGKVIGDQLPPESTVA